ncbi:MAG: glycosyltransferase family 9 protein [Bacteroidota bacterium]
MKILILRFSSIGDIVLTTPVVRGLKQQLKATVHYLTKVAYQPVLQANPYIDQLWSFRKEPDEVLPQLKAEQYDVVIDLHNNLRSLRLQLALRRPQRRFRKLNWQKWLMVRFKTNRLPDLHIVDRYFETVLSLGIQNDGKGLDYYYQLPDGSGAAYAAQVLKATSADALPAYLAIGVGAAHYTKRIPKEKLLAICHAATCPVVLLGGPEEKETGAWLAEHSAAHVVNTCGQTTLSETAALIEHARVVLSPDTGVMHMAAAFQRPLVVLWGNTIPDFGMYPYYKRGVNHWKAFEVKDLPCRPCSKIGFDQCPKGHFSCMQQHSVSAVMEVVGQLWQAEERWQ